MMPLNLWQPLTVGNSKEAFCIPSRCARTSRFFFSFSFSFFLCCFSLSTRIELEKMMGPCEGKREIGVKTEDKSLSPFRIGKSPDVELIIDSGHHDLYPDEITTRTVYNVDKNIYVFFLFLLIDLSTCTARCFVAGALTAWSCGSSHWGHYSRGSAEYFEKRKQNYKFIFSPPFSHFFFFPLHKQLALLTFTAYKLRSNLI